MDWFLELECAASENYETHVWESARHISSELLNLSHE